VKRVYISVFLGLLFTPLPALLHADMCLDCHQVFEEDDGPSHRIARDIHLQKGLSCAACHGGDPNLDDMDDVRQTKSYRGVPGHLEIPQFCARCHSDADYMHEHNPSLPVDQLEKYKTSVHGERLFNKRDEKVANCVSCHTVHEIADARLPYSSTYPLNLPQTCGHCHADEEYMSSYSIPTDQLSAYNQSVHGMALFEKEDLSAPACNDCHGNHGAAPPGVSSLSAVCGLCHAIEAQLFDKSPHRQAFAENDYPMCEVCHGNHEIISPSDDMIGLEDPGLCGDCHSRDDGTRAAVTIDSIEVSLNDLVRERDSAQGLLHEAVEKGMMTRDEEFLMKDVDQALIQTRTLIHKFQADTLAGRARQGIEMARQVQVQSAGLIDQYYFRRKGLAIATLIITILAIALYIKIRRLKS
jgi:predicted CXXCH cytochrome family protein